MSEKDEKKLKENFFWFTSIFLIILNPLFLFYSVFSCVYALFIHSQNKEKGETPKKEQPENKIKAEEPKKPKTVKPETIKCLENQQKLKEDSDNLRTKGGLLKEKGSDLEFKKMGGASGELTYNELSRSTKSIC